MDEDEQYILKQAAEIVEAEAARIENPLLRLKSRLIDLGKSTITALAYSDSNFAGNVYTGAWYVDNNRA